MSNLLRARCRLGAITLSALGVASVGVTAASAADIDVMTQNQYLGADLTPVVVAATAQPFNEAAFNNAVVAALKGIAASQPAERARALAAEIRQRNPDIVGLQEAYKFGCAPYPGAPVPPNRGCNDPEIKAAFTDQLENTDIALRGRYVVVGKVTNLNIAGIPFSINGYPALLSVADRDAILVRTGLAASWVDFGSLGACAKPSNQGCNFQTAPAPLPTPFGNIAIERGFLAADVTIKGREYRVFNTHLELRQLLPSLPETRLLQVGQAYELLGSALGTWDGTRKLIIVGDINSDPRDTIPIPPYPATLPWAPTLPTLPPYKVFTLNGLTDAWTLRPRSDAGLSCCQFEDLTNRKSEMYERIDMIFSIPRPARVLDMKLLGNTMGDKLRPPGAGGLWPSDHGALAAKLQFD